MMLLILGSGDIARRLAWMAAQVEALAVTVAESDVAAHHWPESVECIAASWPDAPWALPPGTHAVVARGHDRDAESLQALLERDVERAYLVASARRARDVLDTLRRALGEHASLRRISSPAGLDLGGQESGAIALSILAEVQWRRCGGTASLRPTSELRESRIAHSASGQRHRACPGKRA